MKEICANFRSNVCESVGAYVRCEGARERCTFPTEFRLDRVGLEQLRQEITRPPVIKEHREDTPI